MQIDSIDVQSSFSVRLNDDGRVPSEDREELRRSQNIQMSSILSPTDQEGTVNLKDMLGSNVTLDQLLLETEVQAVGPVIETDKDNVYALPEDVQKKGHIRGLARQIVLYERDRRNAAKRDGFDDIKGLTQEDISRILEEIIASNAETEERATEQRQFAQDYMAEIIRKTEYYMRDWGFDITSL